MAVVFATRVPDEAPETTGLPEMQVTGLPELAVTGLPDSEARAPQRNNQHPRDRGTLEDRPLPGTAPC
ncbi:hypothetical protein [Nonomuraea sp. NPDC050786]|uniref:hypothetical protein n=1 Tax=Nonomuraea sp. NPDC050786 TaxID=3154840 RepID=UPI0033E18DBE